MPFLAASTTTDTPDLAFDLIPTQLDSPTFGTLIRRGIDRGSALSALNYHYCPVTGQ
jgi:hypothetical protein